MKLPIGHPEDGIRTVTFNPPPIQEAAYRAGRLGSRVTGFVGVGAGLLALVSLGASLYFAWKVSGDIPQLIAMGVGAVALTAAIVGLPTAAALTSRNYASDAAWANGLWALMVAFFVVCGLFYSVQTAMQVRVTPIASAPSPAYSSRMQDLRAQLDNLSEAEWQAWDASANCEAPPRSLASRCRAINARRQSQWEELRRVEHAAVAEMAPPALPVILAGLLASVFVATLAAIASGKLVRIGVLACSESYLLAEGGARGEPAKVSVTLPDISDAPAGMTPEQLFASWFRSNVRLNRDAQLVSREAVASYRLTCAKHGYPEASDTAFFKWLAAEAAATGGKVFSGRSNGMLYHGWELEPFRVTEVAGASPLPDRPE